MLDSEHLTTEPSGPEYVDSLTDYSSVHRDTNAKLPQLVALTSSEPRRRMLFKARGQDLGAELDLLASHGVAFVSLAHVRALRRGLADARVAQELLLCIDAEGAARDDIVALLHRRHLPSVWFADAGEAGPRGGAGMVAALRELSERGVSVEMRGRSEWEQGHVTAEHAFAQMLRARRELERRLGRPITTYRLATRRPRAEFSAWLDRLGYELSVGAAKSGASLEIASWRECSNFAAEAAD